MINDLLQNKDWEGAKNEITKLLDNDKEGDINDETKHLLEYNLIVCEINLTNFQYAKKLMRGNSKFLTPSEIKILSKEIPQKDQTKIKDGAIVSLGFFQSTTHFNDVIGLESVKQYLKKNIIYQIKYPEKYKQVGAELNAGAIFYGPPGTGKTLLARAVAGEVGGRMLVVKLPDIINKFAGDSEKNIKKVFDEARSKRPSIIFIDEIDGIGQKRENADNDVGQGALTHNIVTTLLSELDGISQDMENIYTIGTTNKPWALDSALTRSGRISDKIYVPLPKLRDKKALYAYYLKKMPLAKMDYMKLALKSFVFSPADIKAVCQMTANAKAAALVEGKASAVINMRDIAKSIKAKRKEVETLDWFASALKELKGKSKAERVQYKRLIKDIKFWYLKAPFYEKLNNALSLII